MEAHRAVLTGLATFTAAAVALAMFIAPMVLVQVPHVQHAPLSRAPQRWQTTEWRGWHHTPSRSPVPATAAHLLQQQRGLDRRIVAAKGCTATCAELQQQRGHRFTRTTATTVTTKTTATTLTTLIIATTATTVTTKTAATTTAPHSPPFWARCEEGTGGHLADLEVAAQAPGFPVTVPIGQGAPLPPSAPNMLLTLRRIQPNDCTSVAVARSYGGHAWEGMQPEPLHLECNHTLCTAPLCPAIRTFDHISYYYEVVPDHRCVLPYKCRNML